MQPHKVTGKQVVSDWFEACIVENRQGLIDQGPRNKETPTIFMFLKLAHLPYCKFERPKAAIRAQMKHSTEAAKPCGMEAIRAPTFPTK